MSVDRWDMWIVNYWTELRGQLVFVEIYYKDDEEEVAINLMVQWLAAPLPSSIHI